MGGAAISQDEMEECPDPEQEPEDEDDTDIHLEAVILAGWTELEPRFKLKMLLSWFSWTYVIPSKVYHGIIGTYGECGTPNARKESNEGLGSLT